MTKFEFIILVISTGNVNIIQGCPGLGVYQYRFEINADRRSQAKEVVDNIISNEHADITYYQVNLDIVQPNIPCKNYSMTYNYIKLLDLIDKHYDTYGKDGTWTMLDSLSNIFNSELTSTDLDMISNYHPTLKKFINSIRSIKSIL